MTKLIDFRKPNSWRDRCSNPEAIDAWDFAHRKRLGWRAGLKFFDTSGNVGLLIAARHWPHKLCWDWSVTVNWHRTKYDGPRRFLLRHSRYYRSGGLHFWFCNFNWHWQDYGYMPGINFQAGAPKVYWKHHLENAPVAGVA